MLSSIFSDEWVSFTDVPAFGGWIHRLKSEPDAKKISVEEGDKMLDVLLSGRLVWGITDARKLQLMEALEKRHS